MAQVRPARARARRARAMRAGCIRDGAATSLRSRGLDRSRQLLRRADAGEGPVGLEGRASMQPRDFLVRENDVAYSCGENQTPALPRTRESKAAPLHAGFAPVRTWEGLQTRCFPLRSRGSPSEAQAPIPRRTPPPPPPCRPPPAATLPGTDATPVGQPLPARFHAAIMREPIAAVQRRPHPQTAVTARQGPPFTLPDAHSGCSASLGSRHEAAIRMKGQVRHNVPLSAHGHA